MNIEELRLHCISKPGVTESFPFDQVTLVFKVMNKMFVISNVDHFDGFTAKCDPDRAIDLREQYPHGILPGYHTDKKHWNTVKTNEGVPDALMFELMDHSYQLVVNSLPKKLRQELIDLQ